MWRRILCIFLLLSISTSASADPILLLLLRMIRDQAVGKSVEAGMMGAMRQDPAAPPPTFGYMLPTPPLEKGTEEGRLRSMIDESFLNLSAAQRDSVFASMQKILNDPKNVAIKQQIVAEFMVRARSVREGYLALQKMTSSEKKLLATQAKDEFGRLSAADRQSFLEVLQAGVLPIPRDLNDVLLTEMRSVVSAVSNNRRLD